MNKAENVGVISCYLHNLHFFQIPVISLHTLDSHLVVTSEFFFFENSFENNSVITMTDNVTGIVFQFPDFRRHLSMDYYRLLNNRNYVRSFEVGSEMIQFLLVVISSLVDTKEMVAELPNHVRIYSLHPYIVINHDRLIETMQHYSPHEKSVRRTL